MAVINRTPDSFFDRGIAWCGHRAEEIAGQIRQLEVSLVPQVQEALWLR
jgi:hypothetical protein